MTDSSHDSKDDILQFCPGCGKKIEWNKDLRFCMSCGMHLIRFVPRNKIQDWLGVSLTSEEIEELYAYKPQDQQPSIQPVPVISSFSYRIQRPWKWGAALGLPLLSILAKLIISIAILFVYMLIVIEDITTLDIDAFLDEHIVAITFIELVTQLALFAVPYFFTAIFFPYKAPVKERLESLGIPFGLKAKEIFKEIGIGVGFALLMTGLAFGVQYLSAYLTQWIFNIPASELLGFDVDGTATIFPETIAFTIIYSILMIVSVGPSEEVLFRGFAQRGFQDSFKNEKLGKAMGLIITAIYFTFFHIYIYFLELPLLFFTFLPYFSLSLILGFLYMWRKNLISGITAHALYNIIQFLIVILI